MNDDQILLANAYFDDDLDVDARARAEDDAEVMAEVERLRHLRHELRDTAAPSAAARDAAIAAAMTHFAPAAHQTSTPTPTPSSARRRFDYARPLGIAAALVAIGVLGVVVVNSTGGDDDADGQAAREPATAQSDTADAAGDDAADMEAAASADDFATEDSAAADVFAADGDDAVSSPAMAESTASDDVAELEAAGGAADDVGASADMNEDTAESGETAVVVLRPSPDGAEVIIGGGQLLPTLERLIEVATELTDLRASNVLPPTPNTRCAAPDPDQTSEILAEPDFETESGTRRLLVAVDRVDGYVFAVDPDTCTVVVAGPLPTP